jgi:cellulose synthase/poly-beta-1,6-N-acetylglucosamine synthase-like glycosyltransferase
MQTLEYLFLFSIIAVFYNYAGYAMLVYLANLFTGKKNRLVQKDFYPSVSFIVAAYNEEDCIEKKIINSLQLNYPAECIEYIFITDGSSDGTNEIIRRYTAVRLLYSPERKGKTAAVNRAVSMANNDILIFSDANTMLNEDAIINITRHYSHPKTGGVAGEKKVISEGQEGDSVGAGEGLYWKYESKLKQLDSDFYTVVGAAGELFSVRRELFTPVSNEVILDDFIISMRVVQKGYKVVYEPDAFAMELPSFSLKDEQKRKVRIAAGGFQAIAMLKPLLAFWRHPKLSFLYLSHRVLRWTLSPLCLVVALIANAILFFNDTGLLYTVFFLMQVAFYTMAIMAAILPEKWKQLKPLKLAYYFVFMNLSVLQGFLRYVKGNQSAAWEKARRSAAPSIIKN